MGSGQVIPIAFRQLFCAIIVLPLALIAGGCGSGRTVTIRTIPADASIIVDGEPRPRGPITERFTFGGGQFHTILVTRLGYTDKTILLDDTTEQTEVVVQLKPRSRRVRFQVSPYPAIVKVDGRPVSNGPVVQASAELEFTVDGANNWVRHVVTAERPGFKTAEKLIHFTDADPVYNLELEPERKTVTIRTEPPGAEVIVDGTSFGPSPATLKDLVIVMDPQTNAWIGRSVQAIKQGLEPAKATISWDEGKTDYLLTLGQRSKSIRLKTEPPGAIVKLNEQVLPRKPEGVCEVDLQFAPVNASGEMPVYDLHVSAPADASGIYRPQVLKVGWDEGQVDYAVALEAVPATKPIAEVKPVDRRPPDSRPLDQRIADATTRPATKPADPVGSPVTTARQPRPVTPPPKDKTLALLTPIFRFDKSRWVVQGQSTPLPIVKLTSEPDGRKPVLVVRATQGTIPDGLVSSADGSAIAWTALHQKPDVGLRSKLFILTATGKTDATELTSGEALDLMPSFSPDGLRVLFTSDRMGDGLLGSYEAMIDSPGFAVRVAPGETADTELWPTLDASPRPRLYVEARPANGTEPRLVAIELVSGKRVDLGHIGSQPRISPRADAVAFVRADPVTGKRDIWLLKLGNGEPVNLTRSPDVDDFDPAWSKTGSRIAFASDRPGVNKPSKPDVNLWVLRVTRPDETIQVTANQAHDDNPAWSGDDGGLYFRSSRGGEWGVWKVDLPK